MSRKLSPSASERLSEAQVVLSAAQRGHNEALMDQVNHVLAVELNELNLRLDNLEHDVRMLDRKLDQVIDLLLRAPANASTEQQDAGMISEPEREQRLRDINRRLREILSERAAIEEKWQGKRPLDVSNDLSALDEELAELRRERMQLQEPELTPEMAKEYVDRMWDMMSRLENQLPKLEARIGALEERWSAWIRADALARSKRQSMQNAYGVLFLVVLLVDIVTRFMR